MSPRRRLLAALTAVLTCALALAAGGAAAAALAPSVVGEPPLEGVFRFPQAVAVAPGGGTVFVGDQYSGVVQAFAPDGTFRFRVGARASRREPGRMGVVGGVAVDRSGHLYVVDAEHDRIHVFAAEDGHHLTTWTDPSLDLMSGNPATGSGISTSGIAVWQASADAHPVVYVADQGNDRVERFVVDRTTLRPLGPPTMTNDRGPVDFSFPQGVALNPQGTRLYVADDRHHRVVVLDPVTLAYVAEVGTYGTGAGQIQHPYDVAVDARQLYVADNLNHRVDVFDAESLTFAGAFGRPGYGPGVGNFEIVRAVGALADTPGGGVQVTDTANNRIQTLDAAGTVTAAWGIAGRGPGYVTRPRGVSVAPDGRVAVADTFDHRIALFDPDGTFAGERGRVSASIGFAVAGPDTGQHRLPAGVAFAADGGLWVADTGNDRVVRLAPDGTVAFTTEPGALAGPLGVAADATGGAFVADTGHGRVAHVTSDGTVTVVRDGLSHPAAVAVGADGTPYVAEDAAVRDVRTGAPVPPPSGAGPWDHPAGLAVAGDGTLYVSERRPATPNGARIVRRSPDGAWDTVAVEGPADGDVIEPAGLALTADGGTLLVADTGNNRVLRFDAPGHQPPAMATLRVTVDGMEHGTVRSDLPGIACVTDCRQRYGIGRQVVLTARPSAGTGLFAGWTGACAAAGTAPTCSVAMGADQAVGAAFIVAPPAAAAPPPPPVEIVSLRMTPRTLRPARAAQRRRHRPARRATRARVTVVLTRTAALTVGLQRVRPGRRVGGACRPVTKRHRRARPCVRYVPLPARRAVQARRTTTRFTMTPRFAGRALKPGRYRVTVVAQDADGHRTRAKKLLLRVAR